MSQQSSKGAIFIEGVRHVYEGSTQALIHDPEILVVDEPTVGLDPEELEIATTLEVVFREEKGDGVTIRAVSGSGKFPTGATPVKDPNLEEAYLALMAA